MRARRSFHDRLLWCLGSFFVVFHGRSPFWFWGRSWREERLIRRLLIAYPGLADRPPSQRRAVVDRVFISMRVWKITALSATAGVAAAFLTTPFLFALKTTGLRLPLWAMELLIFLVAGIVTDLVRRWFITRSMNRAVAEAFPGEFCSCGYCLAGLPANSCCPECGRGAPNIEHSSSMR